MLAQRDKQSIWHPFTQHQLSTPMTAIVKGEGAYVYDENGKRLLDLISSWWVNLHGHAHPVIAKSIYDQALQLEHIIFSHFTHEPAVQLAEALLNLLPTGFSKVFYSDNGSTAVEVALKMAIQYWRNKGENSRRKIIAFEKSYHGDTFGAMAVGKKSGFFTPFEDFLFQVDFFPYPATWINDNTVDDKENQILIKLETYIQQYPHEITAMIIEPLVQGAGGMNLCRPEFLQKLEKLFRPYEILIIYDEVMTGFGRTGDYFACNKSSTTPDIICLAKGLTGGFLPLSVTACQEKIYEAFLGETFASAFAHGHSYAANPLGCAAGLASLTLLKQAKEKIAAIEQVHQTELARILDNSSVAQGRYCGTIAAFNINIPAGYGSSISLQLRDLYQKAGLLIRPLGNVLYLMPPYCITADELRSAYKIIIEKLQGVIS